MKTYYKFRLVGMTQSEALFCSMITLARKEGAKICKKDQLLYDQIREKYREFWAMAI